MMLRPRPVPSLQKLKGVILNESLANHCEIPLFSDLRTAMDSFYLVSFSKDTIGSISFADY
jgi:hypothetical protein